MVQGIEALSETLTDVKERLEFAESVAKRSIEDYRAEWTEVISSLAHESECPQYNGLEINPALIVGEDINNVRAYPGGIVNRCCAGSPGIGFTFAAGGQGGKDQAVKQRVSKGAHHYP